MPLFRRAKIIPQLDTIVNCTDKLLHNWRLQFNGEIHTNILDQCQKLLLNLFGLIAFDYELHTFDENTDPTSEQVKKALMGMLSAFRILIYSPRWIAMAYTKLSPSYRRSQKFLKYFVNQIVKQELSNESSLISERKKTCLIASLVAALQKDENVEAMKAEEDKKGTWKDFISISNHSHRMFRSNTC